MVRGAARCCARVRGGGARPRLRRGGELLGNLCNAGGQDNGDVP
uniref:REF6 n=1 Tax=Arundo donax TaxID=35708 RepID=A0A0A9DN79_ARUDO